MSSSHVQMAQPVLAQPPFWLRLWHMPTITVARFTLRSHVRSGWILLDIVLVWFLYAFLFLNSGGDVPYFFAVSGQGLAAVTILGTVVMTQRAMQARVYLPLARLASRTSYIRGVIVAAGVLRVPLLLMLFVLAMAYHRDNGPCTPVCIAGATVDNISIGMLGLLLNCIIISTLTVVLSIPIATRLAQIIFLVWIVAVLYSNANSDPLAQYLAVVRIPLAPIIACYGFGQAAVIGWYGLVMLVLAIGYIVGLTLLAEFWLRRRDLLLV